ncbi:MAG: ATP-dependent Clp protease adaptor ClpS, partial [Deltaproteobacteria bacterium]|nr:ATP-dependent Clp protease adaptor ClpS [Deltaproteobacteria bacterium]
MASTKQPRRGDDSGLDVAEKPQSKQKLQRPRLYKVLLHNDDYTPMFFVVQILTTVFNKSESDAMGIMLHAHTRG